MLSAAFRRGESAMLRRIFFVVLLMLAPVIMITSTAYSGELYDAVTSGDVDKVGKLLGHGVPVNARHENQNTPLHWAAASSETEVAKFLIEKGADVNARNKNGWTPLHTHGRG